MSMDKLHILLGVRIVYLEFIQILTLISTGSSHYLSAELFRGELERGSDLLGEDFGVTEAKRVQGDLSYHGIVRDHHGHRAKQGL